MSLFTSLRLKSARISANMSQDEVAKKLNVSRRKITAIETNETSVTVDELLAFADLYQVNVVSLILEDYEEPGEEQILCKRYASFLRLLDQLSDKDREDVIWVIKQRIAGYI